MTTAKELLSMIEAVKPDDTEGLLEINAHTECFLEGLKYQSHQIVCPRMKKTIQINHEDGTHYSGLFFSHDRNALKAIRPEGWLFGSKALLLSGERVAYEAWADKFLCRYVESPLLPTAELSELHAIIQAIEWERNNNKEVQS